MYKYSQGQTMIETLVAIFILVMGITAAIGLAIYALATSSNVTKQIIAVGLARQGLEAVKNMRDTNWLQQTSLDTNCYDYASGANDAKCYTHWLNKLYCIDPTNNNGNCDGSGTTQDYFLGFDPTTSSFWNLQRQLNATNYGLMFDSANASNQGFYESGSSGVSCTGGSGMADYCRKIEITKDTASPFDKNVGPRLIVISRVWWVDRKCPRQPDWSTPAPACSVELQTDLTNWKNY